MSSMIDYARGVLEQDGIRIKSQDGAVLDSNSKNCASNTLFCFPCIGSDNNKPDENDEYASLNSNNMLIPYGRIINARLINNDNNSNTNISTTGNANDSNNTTITNTITSASSDSIKSSHNNHLNKTDSNIHTLLLQNEDYDSNVDSDDDDDDDDDDQGNNDYIGNGRNINIDTSNLIELQFMIPTNNNNDIKPTKLIVSIDNLLPRNNNNNNNNNNTINIVDEILNRSYQNVKREKSILVIINPFGGKGSAKDMFNQISKPILDCCASFIHYDIIYTKYHRHAMDIARDLDLNKYDTIVCASGDGIPYEVINGLYRRDDNVQAFNKIVVTQLPCGSGNAMSVSCHWTTNLSYSTLCLLKSIESKIDLMCCRQPSYENDWPRLSFLSQTYGVIAESDINTEFIRWMGPIRFDIGVAFNVLRNKKYPCDIYVKYAAKTKNQLKVHYQNSKHNASLIFDPPSKTPSKSNSVNPLPTSNNNNSNNNDNDNNNNDRDQSTTITEDSFKLKYPFDTNTIEDGWEKIDSDISNNLSIFYTGKMPYMADNVKFFPAALPADGTIDLVITNGNTSVTQMTPILLSLDKGTHVTHPEVIHSKILAYKLIPKLKEDSVISVDGERFPLEPLQVEVLPGLLKTLLRNGSYIDTEFDTILSQG